MLFEGSLKEIMCKCKISFPILKLLKPKKTDMYIYIEVTEYFSKFTLSICSNQTSDHCGGKKDMKTKLKWDI